MVVFVKSNKMMDSFTLLDKIMSVCFYCIVDKGRFARSCRAGFSYRTAWIHISMHCSLPSKVGATEKGRHNRPFVEDQYCEK